MSWFQYLLLTGLLTRQKFSIERILAERPEPVLDLRVVDRGQRFVKLRFSPQSDGQAPITNWIVETKNYIDYDWTREANVSDSTPSV